MKTKEPGSFETSGIKLGKIYKHPRRSKFSSKTTAAKTTNNNNDNSVKAPTAAYTSFGRSIAQAK